MLGLGERTEPMTLADAAAEWGEGAANYTMGSNSRVRTVRARRELGWAPHRRSLLEDIERGSYRKPRSGSAMTTTIEIRPTGAALGADVAGRRLSGPATTLEHIRAALRDHLVLRFRGTELDDASYVAFGRTFGEIEPPEEHTRTASMTAPEFPEMSVIANIIENGVARGEAGDGELKWHTDHGFMERPAGFTMLLAREVPAKGGDTSFLNMYRAYDALPDDLRARIQGRRPSIRRAMPRPASAVPAIWIWKRRSTRATGRASPDRAHPPGDRPKALFLGRRLAPTSRPCRSKRARRCWTRCGRMPRAPNSPGPSGGRSVI